MPPTRSNAAALLEGLRRRALLDGAAFVKVVEGKATERPLILDSSVMH